MNAHITTETNRPATPSTIVLQRKLANGLYRIDEDDVLEKRCSVCHEFWPADNEFFFLSKGTADGLNCQCKACNVDGRIRNGRTRGGKPIQQEVTQ